MTAKEPKQGLNLSLLEQKLDKALTNETEESLNTWLKEKRDKQETLEEASQKFAYNYFEMNEINHYKALKQGFVAGAKWQQERMYSEEEVLEIVSNCDGSISQAKKWFEQFKNK